MSRLIDDKTYAEIIELIAQDPKVALFQRVILAPKVEPKNENEEVKENELQ